MSMQDARHFLARTGFAPSMFEIEQLAERTPRERIEQALVNVRTTPSTAPPAFEGGSLMQRQRTLRKESDLEPMEKRSKKRALRRSARKGMMELAYWWYDEMIRTPSPLTERLVFFWHNHFTTSAQKVRDPGFMLDQNLLLRQHAAGDFKALLHGISRDPAMLLYLDGQSNVKRKPNENFARELLELFTLGEGEGYTEEDIREAARAFTGWRVNPKTGAFEFFERKHDAGQKTFLGQTGAFTGQDILDILLTRPRLSEHIAERLWKEFVGSEPDPKEIVRLGRVFRKADYDLKPLLLELFTSKGFLDESLHGGQIKSPVELIVGTHRLFNVPISNPKRVVVSGRELGQAPFYPPTVKGWEGGTSWITTDTLYRRQQLMHRIFRVEENLPEVRAQGASALLGEGNHTPAQARQQIQALLLPVDPVHLPDTDGDLIEFIYSLALDPAYQLK